MFSIGSPQLKPKPAVRAKPVKRECDMIYVYSILVDMIEIL